MAIATLLIGTFLSYGTSKYFPKDLKNYAQIFSKYRVLTKVLAFIILLISAFLFVQDFDLATGLLVFISGFMLALSVLVITLPIHKNFSYLFALIIVVAFVLQFIS